MPIRVRICRSISIYLKKSLAQAMAIADPAPFASEMCAAPTVSHYW
jgi:hypothetical protein